MHIGSAWFDGVEMDGIEVGVGGVMGGAMNERFKFLEITNSQHIKRKDSALNSDGKREVTN